MRTSLAIDAITVAHRTGLIAGNAIMHTDRGGQYHARLYRSTLERPGDECIYYGDTGFAIQGGTTYRLCFRGGVLAFKGGSGGNFDAPTATPS